jgi:hypothetical protein
MKSFLVTCGNTAVNKEIPSFSIAAMAVRVYGLSHEITVVLIG